MCLISLTELSEAQAKEVWAAELAQQQRDKLQCFANRIATAICLLRDHRRGLSGETHRVYELASRWHDQTNGTDDMNRYTKDGRLIDGQGNIDPRPPLDPTSNKPRWDFECEVCGATPAHPLTGMCGPCTFGEAETIGGNW